MIIGTAFKSETEVLSEGIAKRIGSLGRTHPRELFVRVGRHEKFGGTARQNRGLTSRSRPQQPAGSCLLQCCVADLCIQNVHTQIFGPELHLKTYLLHDELA